MSDGSVRWIERPVRRIERGPEATMPPGGRPPNDGPRTTARQLLRLGRVVEELDDGAQHPASRLPRLVREALAHVEIEDQELEGIVDREVASLEQDVDPGRRAAGALELAVGLAAARNVGRGGREDLPLYGLDRRARQNETQLSERAGRHLGLDQLQEIIRQGQER